MITVMMRHEEDYKRVKLGDFDPDKIESLRNLIKSSSIYLNGNLYKYGTSQFVNTFDLGIVLEFVLEDKINE